MWTENILSVFATGLVWTENILYVFKFIRINVDGALVDVCVFIFGQNCSYSF